MLKLDNVYKSFGGVTATRNVTLDFAAGSFSAVIGPNGAGKTTLFNLITGRFAPSAGRILLDGKDIAGLAPTPDRASRHRAGVPGGKPVSDTDRGGGAGSGGAGASA